MGGSKVEKVCEAASISLNRNTVPGDASALSPGGVRIGAPAMTTRGCTTEDFKKIAEFLDRCASIALDIQKEKGKKLKDFEEGLKESKAVLELRKDVQAFSLGFGYPGLWGSCLHVEVSAHSFRGFIFCRLPAVRGPCVNPSWSVMDTRSEPLATCSAQFSGFY